MKLNEKALASASGIFTGIIYVFCAAGVALFPGFAKALTVSWFHGVDLGKIWTGAPRGNFILGFLSAVILSWLAGWLFAKLYNKLIK